MCLTLLVFHHNSEPVASSAARLTVLYLWNLHLLDLSKIRGVIADGTGFHFITARGWIPGGGKQAGGPDFPLVSSVDPSYCLCPGPEVLPFSHHPHLAPTPNSAKCVLKAATS